MTDILASAVNQARTVSRPHAARLNLRPHSHVLPPPLKPARDMLATWTDVELDFDTAAERLVQAHLADGDARDLRLESLKDWAVAEIDGELGLRPLFAGNEAMKLRSSALSSLMTRVGVPAEYLRRVPAPLQLAMLNYGLLVDENTAPVMLRLRNGEVSALVSERYAPLDPHELVDSLRSTLQRSGLLQEVRVRGVAAGVVDNLRLVIPSQNEVVKVGDVSAVGIDISSSSFARSALHVTPVVWRLVCQNGLRRPYGGDQLSFRHAGDPRRLRDAFTEAVPQALGGARDMLGLWSRAVSCMVHEVDRYLRSMRELTARDRTSIADALCLEVGARELPAAVPVYDFVNAMTHAAKSSSPARRLELEGIAGRVLTQHAGAA